VFDLSNIKCFLLDMDGTIHISYQVFDGAKAAIEQMKKQGRVIYITNKVIHSTKYYIKKLNSMGIKSSKDDFYTATNATVDYLKTNYPNKNIWLFGTKSLHKEFAAAGICVINKPFNESIKKEANADLIVVGYNTEMRYFDLGRLCVMIRSGIPFIATQPDLNCPDINGYLPDVGSTLALIKASTNKEPLAICGKPFAPMAEGIMRMVNLPPEQICVFGDRLSTDIKFANDYNMKSVLVLTGEATKKDHDISNIKATYVFNSIKDFIKEK